jgi:hypothetical protein
MVVIPCCPTGYPATTAPAAPLEATARALGIKPATVREYLRRIHSKFADAGDPITNRIQLAKRAWDHTEPE